MHFYIPGWEVDIIRNEMFSDGYGFMVDYLAEILRLLRDQDFSHQYKAYFTPSSDISTRDRDGIHKTFSGLMKILFPHGGATSKEVEELLRFAMEGRKRIKDQLMRLDSTYAAVAFHYSDYNGNDKAVTTLEEVEYPHHYHRTIAEAEPDVAGTPAPAGDVGSVPNDSPVVAAQVEGPKEGHVTFSENQKGVSYDRLLGPYMRGASRITVTDPYIRLYYQVRNFMEFVEIVVRHKESGEEVAIRLVTVEDDIKGDQQRDNLDKIRDACDAVGVDFEWEFDRSGSIHARHIVTDTGWKISLDRGLDIFQHYEMNEAFAFANRMQQFRSCTAFEVTYLRQN